MSGLRELGEGRKLYPSGKDRVPKRDARGGFKRGPRTGLLVRVLGGSQRSVDARSCPVGLSAGGCADGSLPRNAFAVRSRLEVLWQASSHLGANSPPLMA